MGENEQYSKSTLGDKTSILGENEPACMELVLNTPLHLDSLGRPVLDVTRTVNHLCGGRMNTMIRMMVRMAMRESRVAMRI